MMGAASSVTPGRPSRAYGHRQLYGCRSERYPADHASSEPPKVAGRHLTFFDLVKEAKFHSHQVVLWPRRWAAYDPALQLVWQHFEFRDDQAGLVPDSPGVYAFTVEPRIAAAVPSVYPMYIGQTTKQTLRARFRQYLREAAHPKGRPRVRLFLDTYTGYVHFYCATGLGRYTPAEVEDQLLGAYIPPVNGQLPAEIRQIVKAF